MLYFINLHRIGSHLRCSMFLCMGYRKKKSEINPPLFDLFLFILPISTTNIVMIPTHYHRSLDIHTDIQIYTYKYIKTYKYIHTCSVTIHKIYNYIINMNNCSFVEYIINIIYKLVHTNNYNNKNYIYVRTLYKNVQKYILNDLYSVSTWERGGGYNTVNHCVESIPS